MGNLLSKYRCLCHRLQQLHRGRPLIGRRPPGQPRVHPAGPGRVPPAAPAPASPPAPRSFHRQRSPSPPGINIAPPRRCTITPAVCSGVGRLPPASWGNPPKKPVLSARNSMTFGRCRARIIPAIRGKCHLSSLPFKLDPEWKRGDTSSHPCPRPAREDTEVKVEEPPNIAEEEDVSTPPGEPSSEASAMPAPSSPGDLAGEAVPPKRPEEGAATSCRPAPGGFPPPEELAEDHPPVSSTSRDVKAEDHPPVSSTSRDVKAEDHPPVSPASRHVKAEDHPPVSPASRDVKGRKSSSQLSSTPPDSGRSRACKHKRPMPLPRPSLPWERAYPPQAANLDREGGRMILHSPRVAIDSCIPISCHPVWKIPLVHTDSIVVTTSRISHTPMPLSPPTSLQPPVSKNQSPTPMCVDSPLPSVLASPAPAPPTQALVSAVQPATPSTSLLPPVSKNQSPTPMCVDSPLPSVLASPALAPPTQALVSAVQPATPSTSLQPPVSKNQSPTPMCVDSPLPSVLASPAPAPPTQALVSAVQPATPSTSLQPPVSKNQSPTPMCVDSPLPSVLASPAPAPPTPSLTSAGQPTRPLAAPPTLKAQRPAPAVPAAPAVSDNNVSAMDTTSPSLALITDTDCTKRALVDHNVMEHFLTRHQLSEDE
ncbi:uncharacterized protein LOC119231488 [Talpa occidentalis]|uniref:uncharacterized protein LOC119231488 n=1 Tax=Talpa occidentalis TaxID=50954 RepID=UPI00188E0CBA|nr:uncharacterized protein LOC119231488 [Talpa occidentalis]